MIKMKKWIWLDMDGTFVDLYGVDGWLDDLLAHNVRPYRDAKPIYNDIELLEVLATLKFEYGYNIGVITWLARERHAEYDELVTQVKKQWLYDRCFDMVLDKVLVTPYGVRKADTCREYGFGILADDEEQNRNAWDLGQTIDANNNLVKELWKLVQK